MEISVLAWFSGALRILFGGAAGVLVGGRRLLPVSQPSENMRGHVLRVWDSRSGFGVGSGRLETICSMCWIIVSVNQVVQDTRMLRILCVYLFKEPGCCNLFLKILAAFFDRTQNRKTIEKLRFIVWIFRVDCFHLVSVRLIALCSRPRSSVFVQRSNGIEIHLLARCFFGCLHPLLHQSPGSR